MKKCLTLSVFLGSLLTAGAALALDTGTDLNLSMKPAAGGMAGAAYTRPQGPQAAVFGNPATLTQFKGTQFGFGVALLNPDLDNTQTNLGFSNKSTSSAKPYVIPDFAITHELSELAPGLVIGGGVEVNAGLGADFRNSPINAGAGLGLGGAGAGGAATLPLNIELISFGANAVAAKEITPQLSVGGSLTIGFGLFQLGTTGNTTGLTPLTGNFGGTTSSVHDIGVRGTLGLTYQATPGLTLSATVKSPLRYDFKNVTATTVGTVGGLSGFQHMVVEQPAEVIVGAAYDVTHNWMVEADLAWKNWQGASLYQDVFVNQFILLFGTNYKMGPWNLRLGYSYADDILRDQPNGTIGGLAGIGTLPLNTAVPGVLAQNDLLKVVQTTLTPVITKHTLAGGVGYDLTPKARLEVFVAHSFREEVTRTTLALGTYKANLDITAFGAGMNFKF